MSAAMGKMPPLATLLLLLAMACTTLAVDSDWYPGQLKGLRRMTRLRQERQQLRAPRVMPQVLSFFGSNLREANVTIDTLLFFAQPGSAFHTQHKALFEEVQATMLDVRSLLCKEMSIEVLENSFESSATATSIGQEPAHAPLERIPPQPGLVLFRGRQANSPIYVEGRSGFGKNSKQAKLELDDVLQTLLQHGVENTRDEAESVSGTSGDSKRLPKGLAKGKRKTRRRKADRRRRRGRRRKEL